MNKHKHTIIGGLIIGGGVILLAAWIIVFCVPLMKPYFIQQKYEACLGMQTKECIKLQQDLGKKTTIFKYLIAYSSPEAKSERRMNEFFDNAPQAPSIELNQVILPNGQDVQSYQCEHDREWLEKNYPEEAAKCTN